MVKFVDELTPDELKLQLCKALDIIDQMIDSFEEIWPAAKLTIDIIERANKQIIDWRNTGL